LIRRNAIFFIGGPLFFFYKRQSEAIHYYESFLAVSGGPGYEMSRRVGELPRSGFVHIHIENNKGSGNVVISTKSDKNLTDSKPTSCQYLKYSI
jgi:hypothetical protein